MKNIVGYVIYLAAVIITVVVVAAKYFGVSLPPTVAWVMKDPAQSLLVALDDGGLGRAAGEGLERDGAGARADVEDARAGHVAEDVEQRLAHAIRGRTHGVTARRGEGATAPGPRDHSHPRLLGVRSAERKRKLGRCAALLL